MQDFRSLQIWQLSKNLALAIYSATETFPSQEKFGITSQLRRSSSSVCANISEGAARNSRKDFANFINIALGSLAETETFIELSVELKYIKKEKYSEIVGLIEEIRRKTINFNKKLRTQNT